MASAEQEHQHHGKPFEDMCCLVTMEDITEEDGNYVEFQGYPSLIWKPALFEQSVVEQLLSTQFHQFVTRVKTADCQAELRRLLDKGPPIYVEDINGFPLEEGDTHVYKLWYMSDNQERSAMLDGAVEGVEREALWEELRRFLIVDGKEEGDDDDKDEAAETQQQVA